MRSDVTGLAGRSKKNPPVGRHFKQRLFADHVGWNQDKARLVLSQEFEMAERATLVCGTKLSHVVYQASRYIPKAI
jgi:hypothetical protein